ncbi:hypothetical protein K490DRAFT_53139 [Saccharata proteae CBS 121410]|uniref:Uncharacterized protein n=1 Tax=Saccharata proteae CBS 121410 TaxID=1314787 RepID=A0A9P4M276_9PEZI|nr:hypothetical protein K490DRAFT_53139 [Saccharata proteae CBS 121410]
MWFDTSDRPPMEWAGLTIVSEEQGLVMQINEEVVETLLDYVEATNMTLLSRVFHPRRNGKQNRAFRQTQNVEAVWFQGSKKDRLVVVVENGVNILSDRKRSADLGSEPKALKSRASRFFLKNKETSQHKPRFSRFPGIWNPAYDLPGQTQDQGGFDETPQGDTAPSITAATLDEPTVNNQSLNDLTSHPNLPWQSVNGGVQTENQSIVSMAFSMDDFSESDGENAAASRTTIRPETPESDHADGRTYDSANSTELSKILIDSTFGSRTFMQSSRTLIGAPSLLSVLPIAELSDDEPPIATDSGNDEHIYRLNEALRHELDMANALIERLQEQAADHHRAFAHEKRNYLHHRNALEQKNLVLEYENLALEYEKLALEYENWELGARLTQERRACRYQKMKESEARREEQVLMAQLNRVIAEAAAMLSEN